MQFRDIEEEMLCWWKGPLQLKIGESHDDWNFPYPCVVIGKDAEEEVVIIQDFKHFRERVIDREVVSEVLEPAEEEEVRNYMEDREQKLRERVEQTKEELESYRDDMKESAEDYFEGAIAILLANEAELN